MTVLTMTPETREELARAIVSASDILVDASKEVDAIVPIFERLVAERVAAYGGLERAAVAWEANPDAPQEQGILDALAAIRQETSG